MPTRDAELMTHLFSRPEFQISHATSFTTTHAGNSMLARSFQRLLRGQTRCYSVAQEGVAAAHPQPTPTPTPVRYPYYVPRNSQGSLPVYSDIRNNGTRILVLIRNVEGNVEVRAVLCSGALISYLHCILQALAKDITQEFAARPDAQRMKVLVKPRQLVLQGGYWKTDVMSWLVERGF